MFPCQRKRVVQIGVVKESENRSSLTAMKIFPWASRILTLGCLQECNVEQEYNGMTMR